MDEALLERVWQEVQRRLGAETPAPAALLIGDAPPDTLGYRLTQHAPYDAVLIGSIGPGALLRFANDAALQALLDGKPVYLWEDGLPHRGQKQAASRALHAQLLAAERQLLQWGVRFYGAERQKRLITASDARLLKQRHQAPAPDAVLTPMAREILEGGTP